MKLVLGLVVSSVLVTASVRRALATAAQPRTAGWPSDEDSERIRQWRIALQQPPPPPYVGMRLTDLSPSSVADSAELLMSPMALTNDRNEPSNTTTTPTPSPEQIQKLEMQINNLHDEMKTFSQLSKNLTLNQRFIIEDVRLLKARTNNGIWIFLIALTLIIVAIVLPLLLYLLLTRKFFTFRQYSVSGRPLTMHASMHTHGVTKGHQAPPVGSPLSDIFGVSVDGSQASPPPMPPPPPSAHSPNSQASKLPQPSQTNSLPQRSRT